MQRDIRSFLDPPDLTLPPSWQIRAGGNSLSLEELYQRRGNLKFRSNTAHFRIRSSAICDDQRDAVEDEFGASSVGGLRHGMTADTKNQQQNSSISSMMHSSRIRQRPDDEFVDFVVASQLIAGAASKQQQQQQRKLIKCFSAPAGGGHGSGFAQHDDMPRQLTCNTNGGMTSSSSSSLLISVAQSSTRLYRAEAYCGNNNTVDSGDDDDDDDRGMTSVVKQVAVFDTGAAYSRGGLLMGSSSSSSSGGGGASSQMNHLAVLAVSKQQRTTTAGGLGGDNTAMINMLHVVDCERPSLVAQVLTLPERHQKRGNNVTDLISCGSNLVAACTPMTRSILVWDTRVGSHACMPVAQWSTIADGNHQNSKGGGAAASASLTSFVSNSSSNRMMNSSGSSSSSSATSSLGGTMMTSSLSGAPIALSTAHTTAGATCLVAADGDGMMKTWDLRMVPSTSFTSSSSSSATTKLLYSFSLRSIAEAAVQASYQYDHRNVIGRVASMREDPIRPNAVWVNTTGGFVGRVDLSKTGGIAHALYSDDSFRGPTSVGLPPLQMAVMSGGSRCGSGVVVACPRLLSSSVTVMAACDLNLSSSNNQCRGVSCASNNLVHQQQQQQQSGGTERQCQFLLADDDDDDVKDSAHGGGNNHNQRNLHLRRRRQQQQQDAVYHPVCCAFGTGETLFVEDHQRRLWKRELLV